MSVLSHTIYQDICQNIERQATTKDVIINLLWSRGVQVLLLYRLGRWFYLHKLRIISEILLRASQTIFGVDIAFEALISPGCVLRHPNGIVIGRFSKIERNVTIFQGVTIGKRFTGTISRLDGMPYISEGVTIGTGAKILGPIKIGAFSMIGANSVLTVSIPSNCVVAGIPGRVVKLDGNAVENLQYNDQELQKQLEKLQQQVSSLTSQVEELRRNSANN